MPDRHRELEATFLAVLPDVERAIGFVARRHHLRAEEQDDFAGEVKLALIRNDYAVLAGFRGQSSQLTFLVTVIQHLFIDYRRRLWGKWRPSAEAVRQGSLAVRLETLLSRDGLTLNDAVETLRVTYRCERTREELEALAARLPVRQPRRPPASLDDDTPAADSTTPEAEVESMRTNRQLQALLREFLERLPPQDRLILRMRFERGHSVADVSRTLGLEQKPLYRRVEAILLSLRRSLLARGVQWTQVQELIERGDCHLSLAPAPGENGPAWPSTSRVEA